MKKDFTRWHRIKSEIDLAVTRPFFSPRDIWFCRIGANVGDEENGDDDFVRPVLVFRKFNANICWIIPLTRTTKDSPYYFNFTFIGQTCSSAILSQLRTVDSRRFLSKIGYMDKKLFEVLKQKLKTLLP